MTSHPLTPQIVTAIDVLRPVVRGVDPADWTRPTPCDGWDVRDVLNHTVGGMEIFAAELTGRPAGDHEADWLGDDPVRAFEHAAAVDVDAWQRPVGADRTVEISLGRLPVGLAAVIHLTELVAHAVDLAVATGQESLLDERLCAGLLESMHAMGGIDAYRVPGVFGPAVGAPAAAPPHVQLAAHLGRTVSAESPQPAVG